MLKIEKEYENKYGNIPYDLSGRIDILCKALKKKRKKYKKDIFAEISNIRDIKWNEISYVIYLLPKATPRPRLNRNKNLFYVKGSDVNRKLFYKFMEKNPHDLITTPMKMTIDVYLPTPVSLSPEDRIIAELGYIRPIGKPDFDNVAKAYADMIQGLLIYDDALIIEGISRKWYSIKPRIEIKIKYMESFDSLFNLNKIESKLKKGTNNHG